MDKQDPPFTIKVGLTEGCCLYCDFCGIHGIRKSAGDFKFLNPQVAKKIADKIAETGWSSKIEFTLYGEPTIHPYKESILKAFRKALPNTQMMLTSNGGGLQRKPNDAVQKLFDSGLNVLALDDYKHSNLAEKVIKDLKKKKTVKVVHYPEEGNEASPHKRRKPNEHIVVAIKDITTGISTRKLSNHCGCAAPLDVSHRKKRCARPFRELTIDHSGDIRLCCNDWRGVYSCGNIMDASLEELWNGPRFVSARKKLYARERTFAPCYGCNNISYRVGFLPDKKGKKDLPPPTKKDDRVIKKVLALPPLTKPVLRPWEKDNYKYGLRKFL